MIKISVNLQRLCFVATDVRLDSDMKRVFDKIKIRVARQLVMLFLVFGTALGVKGQSVGLKTNLAADGFLSPNIGIEIGLAPRWTVDLTGQLNFWDINYHKWKHWLVQPEFRYWFCDRFARHFLGFHALAGQYNFGNIRNDISFLNNDFSPLADSRYEGRAVGAGIAYGYSWILGNHWNFELELGVGYIYTRYDSFVCAYCGRRRETDRPYHYIGPTKAAINLVYVF